MQKIQPVQEMLSVFGLASPRQALTTSSKSHSLAFSLISAFLIVLSVSLVLRLSTTALSSNTTATAATTTSVSKEAVAFQPGAFVSEKISQGYMGSYR